MAKPLRILIIDDSQTDADLIVYALRSGDFAPVCRRVDHEEALRDALSSQSWDIITSDHSMPLFSAPDALAVVLEMRPNIPVIIVSGEIDIDLAVFLMRSGACDYVRKEDLARLPLAIERGLREGELARERLEMQKALASSEKRLRRAELVGQLGHWTVTVEERKLYLSEGAGNLLGLGNHVWNLDEMAKVVYPEYWPALQDAMRELQAGKKTSQIEFKVRRPAGRKVFYLHARAVFDAEKNVFFGTLRDVTAVKKAQEELVSLNSRLEGMVQERTEQLERMNAGLEKTNTILATEIRQRKWAQREINRLNEELEEKVQERTAQLAVSNAVLAETNARLEQEISERKLAEAELVAKDELIRMAGSMASVGGWEFDVDTMRGAWTDEVAHIHEMEPSVDPDVALGVSFFGDDSRVKIESALQDAISLAKPYDLELKMITARGTEKWVRTIGNPVISGGRVVKVRGIIQDISERKKSENEFLQLMNSLEKRVQERTRELQTFVYSVAHDLRAPNRHMCEYARIMEDEYGPELPHGALKLLENIRAAGKKQTGMMESLLFLSKVGYTEFVMEPVNLEQIAHEVIGALRRNDPYRRVDFRIHGDDFTVDTDRRLMSIVLENLLNNAWKYTARVDMPRIVFGSDNQGGQIVYYVEDNGAGFDMKHVQRLFVAFQRLHSETDFSGHGVGLSVVERIIKRQGGEIWAESEVGKGAVFYFTLEPKPAQINGIAE